MEGWRQWLTRPEKTLVQKNKITHLTPTGLLMEGDSTHYTGIDYTEAKGPSSMPGL